LNLVPQTHKKGVLLTHRHNSGGGAYFFYLRIFFWGGGWATEFGKGKIKITGVRVGETGVCIARTGSNQTSPSFQIECFVKMQILMVKLTHTLPNVIGQVVCLCAHLTTALISELCCMKSA